MLIIASTTGNKFPLIYDIVNCSIFLSLILTLQVTPSIRFSSNSSFNLNLVSEVLNVDIDLKVMVPSSSTFMMNVGFNAPTVFRRRKLRPGESGQKKWKNIEREKIGKGNSVN